MKEKYISQGGVLLPASPEISKAGTDHANQVHAGARRRHECWAGLSQMARCEGDCPTCQCYTNRPTSLDALQYQRNNRSADRLRCAEILSDMQRIDPRGYVIGRMIMDGYTAVAIASHLGMATSTYHDLLMRIRKQLRGE